MTAIRVLSPQVANQIAAGEVVERPASVVKELVENAIDAGASVIRIEIENGGIDRITVSDNGSGIPAEDCATAFLRHATSKLRSADDILHIQTLGFRGEALPSIASVSEVTLRTRTADAEHGTLIRIDNGELSRNAPCACPQGTTMEVCGLFAKTPARLKFLKNARTEAGYIGDFVSRMILVRPDLSFEYVNNGKTVYQTYGDGELKNAVYCVYGSDVLRHIRSVFFDDGYVRISGYVGTEDLARPNRMQQSIFLNGRYIRSAAISNALSRAYDTRLMSGKFPFAVLNIRIATEEIDVNVHPTKMEVRFTDERRVSCAVYDACLNALQPPIGAGVEGAQSPSPELRPQTAKQPSPSLSVGDAQQRPWVPAPMAAAPHSAQWDALRSATSAPVHKVREPAEGRAFAPAYQQQTPSVATPALWKPKDGGVIAASPVSAAEVSLFSDDSCRILGVAFAGYWIVEQGNALFLIDQHAAHERKLYERLLGKKAEVVSQSLLVHKTVQLPPEEYAALCTNIGALSELGFDLALSDEKMTAELCAVPQIDGVPLTDDFLRDALEQLVSTGKASSAALRKESLMQSACKHAVKVGERIDEQEIRALMKEYAAGGIPMTCPHGRPVMVRLTKLEIEKLFKRVL